MEVKKLLVILFIFTSVISMYSQVESEDVMGGICEELYEEEGPAVSDAEVTPYRHDFSSWCKKNHIADALEVGVSLNSTGLGIDLKTRVTEWVGVRAGVDWFPAFSVPMHFNLNTFAGGEATNNFKNIADRLYNMTGILMDETVDMTGRGSMLNFKFLVDVYPFRGNRHWHFTAGFYAGTSKVGKAYNVYGEKPTLVGLNIYNRAYEYFTTLKSIFNVPLGGGAYMDPELVMEIRDRFEHYGRMGVRIGTFSHDIYHPETDELLYKEGDHYIMEPAPDGTISARAYVNHFKPYLGAGYSTDLDKSGRWHFGIDLGVLFWGGKPNVINHDYSKDVDINFTKDLVNIRGKVGDYMKIIKKFPVFPMVAVRFSYSIWK
ncbi:MAG: hypothetical protein J1F38_02535 [Muribaculaceae bacterium]|nr:hypothetical protein [Muribaculaceae bacterium]